MAIKIEMEGSVGSLHFKATIEGEDDEIWALLKKLIQEQKDFDRSRPALPEKHADKTT